MCLEQPLKAVVINDVVKTKEAGNFLFRFFYTVSTFAGGKLSVSNIGWF